MKNFLLLLLSTFMLSMLLGACSNDESNVNNDGILKSISVTIKNIEGPEKLRSTYVVDPELGFVSSWSEGDVIGIYPLEGDQVAFPISEGEGSSTAYFDGGSWALRSNVKYSAYYPFRKEFYTIPETEIPVSYVGQSQNGNNSTAGLAAFDYLAAPAVMPNRSGSVDLQMEHLGAFVRFRLTLLKNVTLKKANISSTGNQFVTTGTVDLSAAHPAITPIMTSPDFDVTLSNISYTKSDAITLYAMVAPVDLSAAKLRITLTDSNNMTYIYEHDGANFVAGASYDFAIAEATDGTGATGSDYEYVNLQLPSGTLWATKNIGASKTKDYGNYYAWGETEPKSNYFWPTYMYCEGSSNTMTKYCISDAYGTVDNKTELDLEDDAAYVNWGTYWCMPTKEQFEELRDCCTWTWTYDGCYGFLGTRKGNSSLKIFFPAAGYYSVTNFYNSGSSGNYWSRSLYTDTGASFRAVRFSYLNGGSVNNMVGSSERYFGYPIRAVRKR